MIIGLVGISKSGKDTAGKYLAENYGYNRIAFGDKVKECLATLLGVNVNFIEKNKNSTKELLGLYHDNGFNMGGNSPHHMVTPITIRHALQRMGTEVGRDILGGNLWVNLALGGLNHNSPGSSIVVTDARFQNEVDYINKMGGICWRINREEAERDDPHASEQTSDLRNISLELQNNSTLETFYAALDEAMLRLGEYKSGS